jgi:hypothetical protein
MEGQRYECILHCEWHGRWSLLQLDFTVAQVVPYIIEEEIMERMGEMKTFNTILQMRNQ